MSFLVKKFESLERVYRWGALWALLEFAYMLFWLGSMIYLVVNDNSIEAQRTFHAFLSIHMVTIPAILLYILETQNRYWFLLWILFGTLFLDVYAVLDVFLHLPRVPETAWNIECAGAVWTLAMSTLIVFWYF